MSSYYFKNTKYNTIGYSHLRDIQSKLDKFTVLPEFGITVFDADNPPFERDNNYRVHDVYAHIPSRESQISKRGAYQANQNLTTMYKRKAPSSVYNSARFDAEFGRSAPVALKKPRTELQMRAASQQAAWQAKNSLATQVRRLIAGKKKDAADVERANTLMSVTRICCLTSSTANATAASGTGLIATDADKAQINNVRIKGRLIVRPLACTAAQLAATTSMAGRLRMMVVWFYKPQTATSAAGTLPAITEVLVSDSASSLPVPDTQNQGRFQILSDRTFEVGTNLHASDAVINAVTGDLYHNIDYTVKVNKSCSFSNNADPSSNLGGHYDSDEKKGQISRGLLMLYLLADGMGNVAGTDGGYGLLTISSRLNYTA